MTRSQPEASQHSAQKKILSLAAIALFVSCLFPPWACVIERENSRIYRSVAIYDFILAPPHECAIFKDSSPRGDMRIDFGRLLVIWAALVTLTSFALLVTKSEDE